MRGKLDPLMMQNEADRIIAVQIVPAIPFIGCIRQVHQLRRLRAEELEGRLVAGKQRRDQLHLALRSRPVQTLVHNGRAGLLVLAGQQLHVAEPGEKIVQLQLRAGRRVGELGKFRLGAAL